MPQNKDTMIAHACMIGFALLISGSFPIGTVISGKNRSCRADVYAVCAGGVNFGVSLFLAWKDAETVFQKTLAFYTAWGVFFILFCIHV